VNIPIGILHSITYPLAQVGTVGEYPEPFRETADKPIAKWGVCYAFQIPRKTANEEITSITNVKN